MHNYVLKAKALWKIIHNEIETRTKKQKDQNLPVGNSMLDQK